MRNKKPQITWPGLRPEPKAVRVSLLCPLVWTRCVLGWREEGRGMIGKEEERKIASALARELTRGPGAPSRRHRPDFTSEGRRRHDGAPGRRVSSGGMHQEEEEAGRRPSLLSFLFSSKKEMGMDTSEASTRASVAEGRRQPGLRGARQPDIRTSAGKKRRSREGRSLRRSRGECASEARGEHRGGKSRCLQHPVFGRERIRCPGQLQSRGRGFLSFSSLRKRSPGP